MITPKRLTVKVLKRIMPDACQEGIRDFKDEFPKGIAITRANLRKYRKHMAYGEFTYAIWSVIRRTICTRSSFKKCMEYPDCPACLMARTQGIDHEIMRIRYEE